MDQITIPVVRHYQKGQTIYVGHLTAKQARRMLFADHYPPAPGRTGYQRPPDQRRAKAFAKYLKEEPSGFMTPMLLNARRPLTFVPTPDCPDTGHLLLSNDEVAAIVDGQHRSLGVQNFLDTDDFPMPFMLFDQLDVILEQELFITINREQKRVSMSHVRFVARNDDPLAELVTRLESDPSSPWYQRVNLVGAKGTQRAVSLQSLRTAMEALLQAGEVKVLALDHQYSIALTFWRCVSDVWAVAWNAPRKSLLTKSMGTLAVAKLGGYLLPRCLRRTDGGVSVDDHQLEGYLRKAQAVDWMSDGTFRGYNGRHGADIIKTRLDALIFAVEAHS